MAGKIHHVKMRPQCFDTYCDESLMAMVFEECEHDFNPGDYVIYEVWDVALQSYTGRKIKKHIRAVQRDTSGNGEVLIRFEEDDQSKE